VRWWIGLRSRSQERATQQLKSTTQHARVHILTILSTHAWWWVLLLGPRAFLCKDGWIERSQPHKIKIETGEAQSRGGTQWISRVVSFCLGEDWPIGSRELSPILWGIAAAAHDLASGPSKKAHVCVNKRWPFFFFRGKDGHSLLWTKSKYYIWYAKNVKNNIHRKLKGKGDRRFSLVFSGVLILY